jgi:hypothetical protein
MTGSECRQRKRNGKSGPGSQPLQLAVPQEPGVARRRAYPTEWAWCRLVGGASDSASRVASSAMRRTMSDG